MSLDKFFNFLKDEKIIYNKWEYSGCFKPSKNEKSYKTNFE